MTTTKKKKAVQDFALPKVSTRAEVNPDAARAFESGGATPAGATTPKTDSATRGRRVLPKDTKSAEAFTRFNAYVPNDLAARVKHAAVDRKVSISVAVTEALESWLAVATAPAAKPVKRAKR